jgi:glycosyltransferase involved in cell wall biosynthesis
MVAGDYDYGGIGRVVTELTSELERYVDVTLVCRSLVRSFPCKARVVELRPRNTAEYWGQLLGMADDFDITHVHDVYALPALVRSRRRGKLVFTDHGIPPMLDAGALHVPGIAFAHVCHKSCLRRTDAVVAISDYIYREACPWAGGSIVRKIPIGIKLERFRHAALTSASISQPTLLHVGLVTKHKGVHFLLRAFKRLLRDFPNAKLVFVGREIENIRPLARTLSIADRTIFCGRVSEPELVKRYIEATVVAVPSYWESFGIPIIEAMALGKPVIARDAYAMKEHIERSRGGVLFRRDDPDEFLAAFHKLMGNYDQLSTNAHAYAKDFDCGHMAREYLELYRELTSAAHQRLIGRRAP